MLANFIRKIERQALLPQGRNYTNLYIKNLEPDSTDDLPQAKFSEFGEVLSAVVMRDDIEKSIEALNGSVLSKNMSDLLFNFPLRIGLPAHSMLHLFLLSGTLHGKKLDSFTSYETDGIK